MKTKLYLLPPVLSLLSGINAAMAQPTLGVVPTNGQFLLHWPANNGGSNGVLQSTASLSSPNWLTATDVFTVNYGSYSAVAVSNSSTARFFRLAVVPPTTNGMALIPAGSFTMGDDLDSESDALPLHTVYVSAFYTDQYDVAEALWAQVYGWATNHGYSLDLPGSVYDGNTKGPDYPVVDVDWYDAVKWCNARSEMEGRTPAYYTDASQAVVYRTGDLAISNSCVNWSAGYRLPTEAEWEKAARGGLNGMRFPWGNTINETQANYQAEPFLYFYDVNSYSGYNTNWNKGNYPYTSLVNTFAPNGYGLCDMAGNVWQWCWDWYDSSWYGNAGATQDDTRGPSGALGSRVMRCGAWGSFASSTRCAYRYYFGPANYGYATGFRSVLPQGQ
jgi:formylglycine-generating enzyme required for sulfatase activity